MADSKERHTSAAIYLTLGKRIKALREAKGMTQHDLAEKADISVGFLSFLERGARKGSLETYWRLAEALGSRLEMFGEALTLKKPYPKETVDLPQLSVAEAKAVTRMVKTLRKR